MELLYLMMQKLQKHLINIQKQSPGGVFENFVKFTGKQSVPATPVTLFKKRP